MLFVGACNKVPGLPPSTSFSMTLPDGSTIEAEKGEFAWDYPDRNISAWSFCNSERLGVLMTSIHLSEKDLIVGKDLPSQAIRFGTVTSSNSNDTTDYYSGHIYLDSVTESTLVFRFEKAISTISKGSFMANGVLVCDRVVLNEDLYYTDGK